MFIDTGTRGYVRPSWVKPTGNAASKMRPDVLSGRSVSINMQPLTGLEHETPDGLATSVDVLKAQHS